MARNPYLSHGTPEEQLLYESLIIESIQIYGHDVYYLPREIVKEDLLFNEDTLSKFDESYILEMYVDNYDGFTGDGTLLTKFGVRIAEECTFVVSKLRWEETVSQSENLKSKTRPNEGDAIFFPLTNQLFQIKFVEHNKPFRQLNDIQTYQLICEVMEYSDERLETGVDEIDLINQEEGYSITFTMVHGIKSIDVIQNGINYNNNTTIEFVPTGGPVSKVATGEVVVIGGAITQAFVTKAGDGYLVEPNVNVIGSGNGAILRANLAPKGTYQLRESITGSHSGSKGKVIRWDGTTRELELIDVTGTFLIGETLIGDESGAEWVIGTYSTLDMMNDAFAENKYFETEGDKIIEFTPDNPFGEYAHMDEDQSYLGYEPGENPEPEFDPDNPLPFNGPNIGGIPVDTSNLGPGTDNYIMIYDADQHKYIFVDPDYILLSSANANDTSVVDPTGLPDEFVQILEDELNIQLDVDGGNF